MGAAGQVSLQSEPRASRIFISYASQDLPIALAIASPSGLLSAMCLQKSILINGFLHAGDEFKKIELRQDLADLFNEREEHVRPINPVLIREMAEKLQSMSMSASRKRRAQGVKRFQYASRDAAGGTRS